MEAAILMVGLEWHRSSRHSVL